MFVLRKYATSLAIALLVASPVTASDTEKAYRGAIWALARSADCFQSGHFGEYTKKVLEEFWWARIRSTQAETSLSDEEAEKIFIADFFRYSSSLWDISKENAAEECFKFHRTSRALIAKQKLESN